MLCAWCIIINMYWANIVYAAKPCLIIAVTCYSCTIPTSPGKTDTDRPTTNPCAAWVDRFSMNKVKLSCTPGIIHSTGMV